MALITRTYTDRSGYTDRATDEPMDVAADSLLDKARAKFPAYLLDESNRVLVTVHVDGGMDYTPAGAKYRHDERTGR